LKLKTEEFEKSEAELDDLTQLETLAVNELNKKIKQQMALIAN
jgi:hypothetical protein